MEFSSYPDCVLAVDPKVGLPMAALSLQSPATSAWVCFVRKLGPEQLVASLDLNALMSCIFFSNTLSLTISLHSYYLYQELFDK